jgi:predicted permease
MAVPETPVLIAVPPALLVNWVGWELPPVLVRPVELLSDGMISTMLVALDVQLAAGLPRLDADMAVASAVLFFTVASVVTFTVVLALV